MAHIHTQPGQHDLTTSAYIIRLDLPEPAVMLHWHRGLDKWMQFGGHVELDENLWQALAREVLEESGYELSHLTLLQPNIERPQLTGVASHPWPAGLLTVKTSYADCADHYHSDINYAFTASAPPIHDIGDGESNKIQTFTRVALAALPDDKIIPNVRQQALWVLDVCLKTWKQTPAEEA